MQIYLPIAEVSVNLYLLLAIGFLVGVLSGMFGVGGGFLMTPLLFFVGIPPAVAVATQANQIVATSLSALVVHWRRRTVDVKMGLVLLAGGLLGSMVGVQVFVYLQTLGQFETVVSLAYVVFLGIVGALMLVETLRANFATQKPRKKHVHNWAHGLPFKMRFRVSNLYISAIPPLMIGFLVGFLAAIMGVGGGFIMVPAMIYLLGMPTKTVIGTSLFQILFVTGATTMMHAVNSHTVDIVLAVILIVGSVIGAQIGAIIALRMPAHRLRLGLALLVVFVALKLLLDLVIEPSELFSLAR